MYPNITVTQVQLRNALIDASLYYQFDSNFMSQSSDKGRVYWLYSPTLDSNSEYFTDENTMLTEEQRYAAFVLAQTL